MLIDRRTLLQLGACATTSLVLPSMAATAPAPPATRLLIRNATVITMDPALDDMAQADVLIDQGAIREVGRHLPVNGAQVLDAGEMILIPGLVDCHWHLWNSLLRNSAPVPGGPPFFASQQAISKRFSPELNELSVRLGLAEAAHAGITTVNSWSHNLRSPEYAQAELRALAASGLRARLWYGYAQELAPTAPMDFKDIQRVQAQLQSAGNARLDLGLAIRGPERTEAPIWEEEFAFAKAHALPISTHIAVSRQMQEKKAIQQLARRGLLNPSVQLVHATHADEQDLASIAQSGATVCITPLTEMRVGYGLPPVAALQRAKLPVTLGIDTLVLGGNANPFMLMQTCLNLAIATSGEEQLMTARDALHWATQGAADAMGIGKQTGSITVGKRADLVLIDTRRLGMFPVNDPLACIVQSATPDDVDTVIADGRIIKRAGQLVGVDLPALRSQAIAGAQHLLQHS
ncbi:cytosine/adenosine deaminase-related metal-dependent hydrolase [Pseudomonas hunanensis]|uniref:Cytosine/adenosine deaminase-related metal-dependent hydrolase n=1 Tax=Pseudomonas hunanensis TaxID=1247546 RepID=A0ACC6JZD2_9PSED|nr:amidohydrolase family protein [Pseudomonas hunanensis]MDR6711466.1 cytosine/adenosine deaminase-related metal-dependent hydrolase [Pseudomonas hunanensis]